MSRGRRRGRGRGRGRCGLMRTAGVTRVSCSQWSIGPGDGITNVYGPPTYEEYVYSILTGWDKKKSSASVFPFAGVAAGPLAPVDNGTSNLDLFSHFFTNEVWDLLVAETNCYAARIRTQTPNTHQRPQTDVTVVKMKAFIGVLFYMAIVRLPALLIYWNKLDQT